MHKSQYKNTQRNTKKQNRKQARIRLIITDHPVVARNPLPRDFRGFRMPREDESGLASAIAHRGEINLNNHDTRRVGHSCAGVDAREVDSSSKLGQGRGSRIEVDLGYFASGVARMESKILASGFPGAESRRKSTPRDELNAGQLAPDDSAELTLAKAGNMEHSVR